MTKSRAEVELESIEAVFKALAHESRRLILQMLQARGGSMVAGDIVSRFGYSWPTMTRHLQQLQEANLVVAKKVGRENYYSLNRERLTSTVNNWMKWFDTKSKYK
jgi:DNA-binding transcriptional ArsR family regulator